jgi:hypothetical protein
MSFFVYDTYDAHNFFHKITDFFLSSFNARMKVLLETKKIIPTKIKNTQEYKNFSPFLCNCFSKCPCNYKSVILSNVQMKVFLSLIDTHYYHASVRGNTGLALLIEAKFKNLKGTADFSYLFAINNAGNIVNFSNAIVNIKNRQNNNTPETQTSNNFFNGVINSINNNDAIHYITNEGLFPKYKSPDYNNFLSLYQRKKNTVSSYCSKIKRMNRNCELFRKISLIMKF